MRKFCCLFIAGLLMQGGTAARVSAQQSERPERDGKAPEAKPPEGCDAAATKEDSSVTDHTIRLGAQTIPYKATAGFTLLKNDKGDSTGLMYSVAYTRSDVKDLSQRPVSFLYNGGPGSATMWLHMGAFGPRRVHVADGEFTPPAPYKLVDNTESLLDKTDLVFIDAMGTGYSHAVCKAENKDFWGIDEDIDAFGQFIDTYLSRNDRWNSPKFLIGESYGTFRSAALGNYLQNHYTIHLNGIVLISSVLDLSTITFGPGDDRCYIFYLPSYAAVAWYHKVLKDRPADLPTFLEEARQYAQGDYANALVQGRFIARGPKGCRRQEARVLHGPERGLPDEGGLAREAGSVHGRTSAQRGPHHRPHRRALHWVHLRSARRVRAGRSRRAGRRRRVHGAHQLLQSRRAEIRQRPRLSQHSRRHRLEMDASTRRRPRIFPGRAKR